MRKNIYIKGSKVANYVSEHLKCYVDNKRYFQALNIKASSLQRMSLFIKLNRDVNTGRFFVHLKKTCQLVSDLET